MKHLRGLNSLLTPRIHRILCFSFRETTSSSPPIWAHVYCFLWSFGCAKKQTLKDTITRTKMLQVWLGGSFEDFSFHPYLGKISNLTHIFEMGWNHQIDRWDISIFLDISRSDPSFWDVIVMASLTFHGRQISWTGLHRFWEIDSSAKWNLRKNDSQVGNFLPRWPSRIQEFMWFFEWSWTCNFQQKYLEHVWSQTFEVFFWWLAFELLKCSTWKSETCSATEVWPGNVASRVETGLLFFECDGSNGELGKIRSIDIPKCHWKHPSKTGGALATNLPPPSVCGGLGVVKTLQRGCFWTALTVLQYSSSPLSDLPPCRGVDLRQHPCRAPWALGAFVRFVWSTFWEVWKHEGNQFFLKAMLGISLYLTRFLSLYILYLIRDTYLYIVMLGYIAVALLQ